MNERSDAREHAEDAREHAELERSARLLEGAREEPPPDLADRVLARLNRDGSILGPSASSSASGETAALEMRGRLRVTRWVAAALVLIALLEGALLYSLHRRESSSVAGSVHPDAEAIRGELTSTRARLEQLEARLAATEAERASFSADIDQAREKQALLSRALAARDATIDTLRSKLVDGESIAANIATLEVRRVAAEEQVTRLEELLRVEREQRTEIARSADRERRRAGSLESQVEELAGELALLRDLAGRTNDRSTGRPGESSPESSRAITTTSASVSSDKPRVVFARRASGYEVSIHGSRHEVLPLLLSVASDTSDPRRADLALRCAENLLGSEPTTPTDAPQNASEEPSTLARVLGRFGGAISDEREEPSREERLQRLRARWREEPGAMTKALDL